MPDIQQYKFCGNIEIAAFNSPDQIVISGPAEEIEELIRMFNEEKDNARHNHVPKQEV